MNRRNFLKTIGFGAGWLTFQGGAFALMSPPKKTGKKMNVLFIASDDLRPMLGCYGDEKAVTPNIDRLAKRGIVFNYAYCQQAVCNPSRVSLMTGRRPDTTKVRDNRTHFRKALPDVVTLPQYFKQHGYFAQDIGKIYHGSKSMQDGVSWSVPEMYNVSNKREQYVLKKNRPGEKSGKQAASECADVADNAYWDGQIADNTVAALRKFKKDNTPFFLAVGFRKPHLPFSAPKKYWDIYGRKEIARPASPKAPEGVPEIALHNWKELRGYTDIPGTGPPAAEKIAELRHGYYACVSYMDAQVGKLLDELDRQKLTDNTVIILWGDHGWHLGELGLWCKTTNFELDTHSPLILAAPGMKKKGIKTDALVEFVDIYPTLVELCGLAMPKGLEGVSVKPLLDEPKRGWKTAAFSQFPRKRNGKKYMGYTMRTKVWRYTEWRDVQSGEVKFRELYDYKSNQIEQVNLAGKPEYTELVKKFGKMLRDGPKAAIVNAEKR